MSAMISLRRHIRSILTVLVVLGWVLLVLRRSPDGLPFYLFNRWSPSDALVLLIGSIMVIVWISSRGGQAVSRFLLCCFGIYLATVVVSTALWFQKRYSYLGNGAQHDAVCMRKHRPGYHWQGIALAERDQVIHLDLDEEGFRNPNPIPEKIDLAFLGDSFTFANEVNWDELFSTRVSRDLNLIGRNYGVSGMGQGTELEVLKKYVLPKKPKAVVVIFFDNDPSDNLWFVEWSKMPRSRAELEGWPIGKDPQDHSIPFLDVFRGSVMADALKGRIFRRSRRGEGVLLETPGGTVHFNHGPVISYLIIPFLERKPWVAERIAAYGEIKGEKVDLQKWVDDVFVRACPEPMRSTEEGQRLLYNMYNDSLRYLHTCDFFRKIISLSVASGSRVLVVRVPLAYYAYRNRMRPVPGTTIEIATACGRQWPGIHSWDRLFGSHIEKLGAKYVSLLQPWEQDPEFYYLKYDVHLNPKGHAELAHVVESELRVLLKLGSR